MDVLGGGTLLQGKRGAMRIEEAEWIARSLERFTTAELDPLLEIGSSTRTYRTIQRPYIEALVHRPLRERGVRIVCTDIKPDDGVDISGDIYDPVTLENLRAVRARAVMCSNILQHVSDPRDFARRCGEVLEPGGLMLISMPQSYPYHVDPIDNGFRADPKTLASLFPEYEVCAAASVSSMTFGQELARKGPRGALKTMVKALAPFHGMARWKARAHRFLWLWRPYRISVVILRKPSE